MQLSYRHNTLSKTMFSKHVKKPRLVIKLTKLEDIQLEKSLKAFSKSIKTELLHC